MSVEEKYVEVNLCSQNIPYYESLGHIIPRRRNSARKMTVPVGSKLIVSIEDLQLGSNVKVTKVCDFCGDKSMQPYNLINKYRDESGKDYCEMCGKIKSGRNRKVKEGCSLADKFPHLLNEWNFEMNDISPNFVSYGSQKSVWWICSKGHQWNTSISNRTGVMKSGCPICKCSKGENSIKTFLVFNNYRSKEQYIFDDLTSKNGVKLKFDFAILDQCDAPICLIEYDGEFHYQVIFDENKFNSQLVNDDLKNQYCEKFNIPLLRIPFWDFDKIQTILNEFLSKLFINKIHVPIN